MRRRPSRDEPDDALCAGVIKHSAQQTTDSKIGSISPYCYGTVSPAMPPLAPHQQNSTYNLII